MNGYLGEVIVSKWRTPYRFYSKVDMAMIYVERYGGIDGDHHKTWVLDQVARIVKGTPLIFMKATWDNGEVEWRFYTDKPSKKYLAWVLEMRGEYDAENEEYEYGYDEGIAP